jgi:hypothetical protein
MKLDVAGDIRSNDLFLTSDSRLKTNVLPFQGALERLQRVGAVQFEWATPEDSPSRTSRRSRIGVIAQEVESVLPELVDTGSEQGYKSVDYAGLVAVLIQGFNELLKENNALRLRVDAIERTLKLDEQASS